MEYKTDYTYDPKEGFKVYYYTTNGLPTASRPVYCKDLAKFLALMDEWNTQYPLAGYKEAAMVDGTDYSFSVSDDLPYVGHYSRNNNTGLGAVYVKNKRSFKRLLRQWNNLPGTVVFTKEKP